MKVVLTAAALFLCGFFSQAQFYGASRAKRGNGVYRSSIYWINWDIDNNSRPGDAITNGLVRTVTTPIGIVYTIRITKQNSTALESYVPGQYFFDDLKTGYNWFNQKANDETWQVPYDEPNDEEYDFMSGPFSFAYDNVIDAHNSVIGIRNKIDGDLDATNHGLAKFTITVSATIGGEPFPILGMVAVGAESLGYYGSNNNPREYETFTATNTDGGNLASAWQAFDRTQNSYDGDGSTDGFKTRASITNNGKTVTNKNISNSQTEGPGEMIWFSKGANQIVTELKGGGNQAIAIGFIGVLDYGDAPESYGTVSNLLDISFSGGTTTGNNVSLATLGLATRNAPKFAIGQLADEETDQFYSNDLKGDDTNGQSDEDGLPNPYKAGILYNNSSVTMSIPVKNASGAAGRLRGWIDINKNGQFDANEKSAIVNIPNGTSGNANLSFTNLPSTFQPFVNYPLRLRLATTIPPDDASTSVDEGAIGYAPGGEVEDHMVKVLDAPVSGNVFIDDNKDKKFDSEETLYAGADLFAYVLDKDNKVVAKANVVDGKYTIEGIPASADITDLDLKLVISTQTLELGDIMTPVTGEAPSGYLISGEDIPAGTAANDNGNAADYVVGFSGSLPTSGISNLNFGMYIEPLAVNFGNITAVVNADGLLTVNWETISEENNDHFDIEASLDGKKFKKIASIKSQVINGNSDKPLTYTISTSLADAAALMGVSLLGLSLLGVGFNRKKSVTMLFASVLAISLTLTFACKKSDYAETKQGKMFIRIAQVDIDGTISYSKPVSVVRQ